MKSNLEELIAFKLVVETGSITAAAERLGQTTSGVSRALGRLERKLDTTLLRRTTRRIELSEEGAVFLAHVRSILSAIDDAEEQLEARREQPSGRLRVNAATPFMLHVLLPLLPGFQAAYPEIRLELDTDELNIDLLERQTDIAIRIGALRDSTMHARLLAESRIRVLASPAYLAARGTPRSVKDLSGHALLGFTQPDFLNRWPLASELSDTYPIIPAMTASSGETLRQMALQGQGIVCLSDFMTKADRDRGDFVQVLQKETVLVHQPINAVYYRNAQLAARIACFLDFVAGKLARSDELSTSRPSGSSS